MQAKIHFQNIIPKLRKFYQQVGGESTKTNEQPDAKEPKQFSIKIWEQKKH